MTMTETKSINRRKHNYSRMLHMLACALLLTGCTLMQPPHVESPHIYVLDPQVPETTKHVKRDLVLAVSMPRARAGFDTSQMVYVRKPHELEYFAVNRWANTPTHMLAPLLLQTLEQTGAFRAVVAAGSAVPANIQLDTELIRLQQDFATSPSRIEITLRAQLIDVLNKRAIAVKLFNETEDAPSEDAYGGVTAANRALQGLLSQVADFCVNESANNN
jgi:cholesterol transport system auxiliary component